MILDPLEKIFEKGRKMTLDKKKKDAMHRELLMFMEKNPIQEKPKKTWTGFHVFYNIFRAHVVAFASVMVMVIVGGIASVTANSALPGSFLYPVKVGINEKVKEVLAFTDEAKLELSIALADRRLQEIEQLAVEEKIDSENEAKLRKNFNAQSKKASEYLDKLNKKGGGKAEEISTRFEASLRAHHIILEGLSQPQNDRGSTIESGEKKDSQEDDKKDSAKKEDSVRDDILNAASAIANINSNIDNDEELVADTEETFDYNEEKEREVEEKISSIEKSIKSIEKLIEKNRDKMESEAVSQSEENLHLIREKLEEGKELLQENNYEISLWALYDASVIAQESKDLIHASIRLGTKVPIRIKPHYNTLNHEMPH